MRHKIFGLGLLFYLMLLQSCALRQEAQISDLHTMPQETLYYLDQSIGPQDVLLDKAEQKKLAREFLSQWFSPWNNTQQIPDTAEFFRYIKELQAEAVFGENKRPRDPAWLAGLVADARLQEYPALDQPGVVTRNSSLRLLPSQRPVYRDFSQAGQGYPFDLLQVSAIWAGSPLRILHVSADQAWYLVQSSFALGWIPVLDVARLGQRSAVNYSQYRFVAIIQDKVTVQDSLGNYLFTAHMGSLFPLLQASKHKFEALVPARDAQGRAVWSSAVFSMDQARIFPVQFGAFQIATLASGLLGQSYGWGGLYENRDCSAMIKDLFAAFGIWLPRNSKQQANTGQVVDLADMDPGDKLRAISEKARPMATLIYVPGHIMLYLGSYQGQPAVLHNMWGLRSRDFWGREGRRVIGETVITSLQPGQDLFWLDRTQGDLLQRVQSMNILIPDAEKTTQNLAP